MDPGGYLKQHDAITPRFHGDFFSADPHPITGSPEAKSTTHEGDLLADRGGGRTNVIDNGGAGVRRALVAAQDGDEDESSAENGAYSVLHDSRMIGDSAPVFDDGF